MEGTIAAMSALQRFALVVPLALLLSLAFPRNAAAEARGQAIPVLAIDSEDSDEQADALTNALRSHVRQTPGWTLMETTQSLSMLTAAFQCPQRPDATCLGRMGDKLKTDQFFWGVMSKAPGHQVTAELHLWSKGKPDKVVRETFSDNLKDANDDNLKRVATSLFSGLLGVATGSIAVHVNADSGAVVVDGVPSGTIAGGRATLTLAAGPHSLEVQSPGFANAKRSIVIDPAAPAQLELTLEAAGAPPAAPSNPLPVRKIVGWTSIGVGVVLAGIGIGFGVADLNNISSVNSLAQNNYQTGLPKSVQDPCHPGVAPTIPSQQACSDVSAEHTDVALEITMLAVGGVAVGVGTYLLLTDHGSSSSPPAEKTGLASVRLLPSVGPGSGSMVVLGQF
jgi:hypothetical protein